MSPLRGDGRPSPTWPHRNPLEPPKDSILATSGRLSYSKGKTMKYKTLGNTGLLVSHLCLGTMTLGGGIGIYKHIGDVTQAGADQLVKASIEAGINFFDTADVYSAGESEQI